MNGGAWGEKPKGKEEVGASTHYRIDGLAASGFETSANSQENLITCLRTDLGMS